MKHYFNSLFTSTILLKSVDVSISLVRCVKGKIKSVFNVKPPRGISYEYKLVCD